jgi:NRAMP (natural resistance-associated macrophage protein)-like metal ion transporter
VKAPTVRAPSIALTPRAVNRVRLAAILGVLGPGLVSGFADNDAGGITTYSVAGAKFGYDLLWVLLVSQIVLFFTQEVGARLGLATGQGLAGLVRERYGVKWAAFMITAMLVANLGSIVAEFAGCGAAVELMGYPSWLGALLAAVVVVVLLTRANYKWVQYVFVAVGAAVSIAYFGSALLAHPDWGLTVNSIFVPHLASSGAYWVAVVATVGTTITPWGQAFIQSYVADKRLGPEDLVGERIDVGFGALLTNLIAAFIVVACAAAVYSTHLNIDTNSADAVQQIAGALKPIAGAGAITVFAVGLLAASFLGLGVVPLTSAYAACEAFGWETGVDWRMREAPAFYGLMIFFVAFAAIFILIVPAGSLVQVMLTAQIVNCLLLPFVLVFVMKLSADRRIMGSLASGRWMLGIGWVGTGLLVILSIALVGTTVLGM